MPRSTQKVSYGDIGSYRYLVLLSLIWIYIGALRSWILPSLSNYLYFAHFPLIVVLWLKTLRIERIRFGLVFFSVFLLIVFQSIHVLLGHLDLVGGIYGLITYVTPLMFIMIFERSSISSQNLMRLTRVILLTLPVNLIIVFLQVVQQSPALQKVDFTESALLGTANGVVRATGTFTSSAGFSFYVIFLGLILYIANSKKIVSTLSSLCLAIILGILTLLSGSRTILLFISLNLIVILFTRNKNGDIKVRSQGLKMAILISIIGSYKILTTSKWQFLQAFSERITQASRTENTTQRVLQSILDPFKHFNDWTLFGRGLGAYGHGSLGYGSNLWVENDLSKNMLECGVILGSIVIFFRFVIALKIIRFPREEWAGQRTECAMAAITFVPLIISGQLTNQGSLLLGIGICTSLVLKLIQSEK